MDNIQKYIINSLVLEPNTAIEIGQNKGLILLLREMIKDTPSYMQEIYDANNQPVFSSDSPQPGTQNLNGDGTVTLSELQRKLRSAVKYFQGSTALFRSMNLVDIDEIIQNATSGNKLNAVKLFKQHSQLGLKESKDIIDRFINVIK